MTCGTARDVITYVADADRRVRPVGVRTAPANGQTLFVAPPLDTPMAHLAWTRGSSRVGRGRRP